MVEWATFKGLTNYRESIARMEDQVDAIARREVEEQVWLLEYPPLFTAGNSAAPDEFGSHLPFPLYRTGRGGRVTYHGPGQRIVYLMLDLNRRDPDIRQFVYQIEQWVIDALYDLGVMGLRLPQHTGVWINVEGEDKKIAAIGLRLRRWVSFHGVAINVDPDLSHYASITPCGIPDKGLTSLAQCIGKICMSDLDAALKNRFAAYFDKATAADVVDSA